MYILGEVNVGFYYVTYFCLLYILKGTFVEFNNLPMSLP